MAEKQSANPCVIGRGVTIKGSVSGAENLEVEGAIEGRVDLRSHLTVRETGSVDAEITAESLVVQGRVHGTIDANGVVSLASAAHVVADIRAARVVLEDGARFKGRIEMDVQLPADI